MKSMGLSAKATLGPSCDMALTGALGVARNFSTMPPISTEPLVTYFKVTLSPGRSFLAWIIFRSVV